MKILINGVTAKMGGAITYINNLLMLISNNPRLAVDEFIFYLPESGINIPVDISPNVIIRKTRIGHRSLERFFLWQQIALRRIIKKEKIDVLFSPTNFAVFFCPCPQLLLVRNALYFSKFYASEILPKKSLFAKIEFFLRRFLAFLSMKSADKVMVPSDSLKNELSAFGRISNEKIIVNHYGINSDLFHPGTSNHPSGAGKLLYLSHYGDYKNFTTLLRALIILKKEGMSDFQLTTPVDFSNVLTREHISFAQDQKLFFDSEIKDNVIFLKNLPYEKTPEIYRENDIFIWPSLVESFGHPLLEAMASGLPVIASDIPINREICGEAATYFNAQNPDDLADKIKSLMRNSDTRGKMREIGFERVKNFSWENHIGKLLEIFKNLG